MLSLYTIIEDSHAIAGFATNILLMYTIVKFSRKSLGPYKELLLIFAAYDVYLVTLHSVLKPVGTQQIVIGSIAMLTPFLPFLLMRVVVVNTTIFGVAAVWDNRASSFAFLTTLYCVSNTVPFALTIIDFLYRYWCIARPHLIQLFSDWRFDLFLVLAVIADFFVWFLLCIQVLAEDGEEIARALLAAETGRRLGKEIKKGWLIMNHWKNNELNVPIFCACMTFDILMIGCFSIAIALGCLCYHHIYVLRGHSISAHALTMQRKLFISVCAQTAVPLLFVYSPYLAVANLPLFRLPVYFWDDACMLLTSCFPAWDGIIVIVLMPDYWKGLLRKIGIGQTKVGKVEIRSIPTISS